MGNTCLPLENGSGDVCSILNHISWFSEFLYSVFSTSGLFFFQSVLILPFLSYQWRCSCFYGWHVVSVTHRNSLLFILPIAICFHAINAFINKYVMWSANLGFLCSLSWSKKILILFGFANPRMNRLGQLYFHFKTNGERIRWLISSYYYNAIVIVISNLEYFP